MKVVLLSNRKIVVVVVVLLLLLLQLQVVSVNILGRGSTQSLRSMLAEGSPTMPSRLLQTMMHPSS
jgi:hypothetical protein